MIDRDGNYYPDPPDDPEERAKWKTRYYAQNYGAGKDAIARIVDDSSMYRDIARRHRRYIWILRGTMFCTLGTLYVLITHPSWYTVSCFIVSCSMGMSVLMNPPRSR